MACWPKARIVVLSLLVLSVPTWSYGQRQGDAVVDIRALTLRDQDGKPVSLRAFEGRTLVLHFIFTHCVAACHMQVKNLKAVREALPVETRARVQFLSVSLDPERDTPETLREYARTMGVDDPGWRFVTASPDRIGQITDTFTVKREKLPDGQIDHTLVVFLFNPAGSLVQRYTSPTVDIARLAREIGSVVELYDPAPRPISPTRQNH
jgi:protein SCO1/2